MQSIVDVRAQLVEHIKGNLQTLRVNEGTDPGDPQIVETNFAYPVGCRKIIKSAVDPKELTSEDLPAIFYGTGEGASIQDEGARFGTSFRGETYRLIVNSVFEKLTGDSLLIETSARFTDAIAMVAENMLNIKQTSPFAIDDVYLERYTPFGSGVSNREFIQYIIRLDFYFNC